MPDPISELELPLGAALAQSAVEAEVALRRADAGAAELKALEALARQLLRAESVASSRIEGLVLSRRRLAKAAFSADLGDVTAQSVLANIKAMEVAIAAASSTKRFGVASLLRIHRELFAALGDPSAGRLRTEQNWIGGAASGPRGAEFVPPPPGEVKRLLEDLVAFMDRDALPPLVQAAVAHAQFETIHPFADGNGRVGRCLVHVVLCRRGVTPRFVAPVSLVLATNSKAYVGGLTDFRAGRVGDWIGPFCVACRTAAHEAERFSRDVRGLQDAWRKRLGAVRADSGALKLLAHLPGTPVLDVATAEDLLGVSNQAARLAMLQLEAAKVLGRINVGRRNRAWEALGLFELLDDFERRLATRSGGKRQLRPAPS